MVAAHAIATSHPSVATPTRASHTHGHNGARVRELVEDVGSAGGFDLMFTEFETTLRGCYSNRTTYFTREILFISRNIYFRFALYPVQSASFRL